MRGHVAHSGTSAGSHIGLCFTTLSVYDSCTRLVPNGASSVYDSGVSEVGVWIMATWSVQDSIPTAVGASCVCVRVRVCVPQQPSRLSVYWLLSEA